MATEFLAEGDDSVSQAMGDIGKFVEWCAKGVIGADLPPEQLV